MAENKNNCDHTWEESGLWDGVDPDTGRSIGGKMYRCTKCEKRARGWDEMIKLGGTINNKQVEKAWQDKVEVMKKAKEKYEEGFKERQKKRQEKKKK